MTDTSLPYPTIDAQSLGFVPSDGVLVRDTPFLADVLRAAHRGSVRAAMLAPLLVLSAVSLILTTEGSLAVPILVMVGALAYSVWTAQRLSAGMPASSEILDSPLRTVFLSPEDIVLTRWRVALRVGASGDRQWLHGWYPRAHREMLLRRRQVLVVRARSTPRVLVLVPGSLAVFGGRLRHSAPEGIHPAAATPNHTVAAVPSRDTVLSMWLAASTVLLMGATVLLSATAAFLASTSLPVLLNGRPEEDMALTYGSAVLAGIMLAGAVVGVLSLRRARTAIASATGWRTLNARIDHMSQVSTGRYRFTATVQHSDGRMESVSARAAFVDIVASIAETGRMWVLDTGADSPTWTVGVPGHPVLDTVTRRR